MEKAEKIKLFNKEINYIHDDILREDAKFLVGSLPDYFFEVDASSTGKYHQKYAAGDKGLARHVKAAVKMAVELLSNPIIGKPYSDRDKDLIIIGTLFQQHIHQICIHIFVLVLPVVADRLRLFFVFDGQRQVD